MNQHDFRMNKHGFKAAQGIRVGCGILTFGAVVACGGGDGTADEREEVQNPTPEIPAPTPGIHVDGDDVAFRTDEVRIDPGEEKFFCSTHTVAEDMVIGGYDSEGPGYLHHLIFAKTTGDEPEGLSECDVLFRFNWEPIFMAGAGESALEFPEGMGHRLPAGTRILAQMHLLNATEEPVTDSVVIRMHPTAAENLRPVGSYVFGNLDVNLPPMQPSSLQGVCNVTERVEFLGVVPHMHMLGKSLTFEVGPSETELTEVFERNPYAFDDQRVQPFALTLEPGDVTRITCNFDNTTTNAITFGESTTNEMCFLLAFAPDRDGVTGCVSGDPAVLIGLLP